MPVPRKLSAAALAVVVVIALAALPAAAHARPAPGLCTMNAARGAVPDGFAVDACVDGTAVWLRDQLEVPLHFVTSGDTGQPVSVRSDAGIAAMVTRLRYLDPLVVLPGDIVRIPIGPGAATVSVADTDAGGFYVLAVTLATFIPVGKAKDVYEAVAGFITDVVAAFGEYADCLARNNWIGQIGCHTTLVGSLTFAAGKAAVLGVAGPILSVLLDTALWTRFIAAQVPAVSKILGSNRTLSQAAAPTGGGKPATTPGAAHACPGGAEFLKQMQRTWTGNHWTSYRITRGPKCVGDWAAADGIVDYTERPPGVTTYEWVVLHWSGSGWSLHGGSGADGPNDMARRDTEACQGPPPALIAFLGCVAS